MAVWYVMRKDRVISSDVNDKTMLIGRMRLHHCDRERNRITYEFKIKRNTKINFQKYLFSYWKKNQAISGFFFYYRLKIKIIYTNIDLWAKICYWWANLWIGFKHIELKYIYNPRKIDYPYVAPVNQIWRK